MHPPQDRNLQSKFWCFTFFPKLNNDDNDDPLYPETVPILYAHDALRDLRLRYFCAQAELCPSTGRLHYQGYLEGSGNIRLQRLRRAFPAGQSVRFAVRLPHSSASCCRTYCSKDDSRAPGHHFFERGIISKPAQGRRSDIHSYAEAVVNGSSDRDLLEDFPATHLRYNRHARDLRLQLANKGVRAMPEVEIHWGVTGAGKTHHVYASHAAEDIYRVMVPRSRGEIPWMDGYQGQPVIFFDEFDGWAPLVWILQVCDKFPLQAPVKGSSTYLTPTKVYFASNQDPANWWEQAPPPQLAAFNRRVTLTKEYTEAYA